jgi:hypothetical protein
MITVAVLGAGTVGCALAERLLHAGAAVRFGVRDPSAASKKLTGALAGVPVWLPAAATADAGIILLAVPAAAVIDAARSAGTLTGANMRANGYARASNDFTSPSTEVEGFPIPGRRGCRLEVGKLQLMHHVPPNSNSRLNALSQGPTISCSTLAVDTIIV